ncbi:hypothetical protein BC941DRAFT_430596 [Chlamydoabsidia padenii]|nr:hypothetical protein BC941DRAFT_430596 [Chlamydoabsidia padenii]
MQSNRKHSWMFGWTPPWHRKTSDMNQHSSTTGHPQRSARKQSHSSSKVATFKTDQIYSSSNTNSSNSFSARQPDQAMDTGSPLSSSNSSFASSFRRNTKESVLDFFHRRKSSTPSSTISLQQSSNVGPMSSYPPGRNSGLSAFNSTAALTNGSTQPYTTLQSTNPTNGVLSTSSPGTLTNPHHQATNIGINPPPPTVTPAIHQHHRFPFVTHHNDSIGAQSPIPEEPCFSSPPSSSSSHYHPQVSSLSSSLTSTLGRPYDTLMKKQGLFYEYTMDMQDCAPPTMDDTKRITLRHDLVKLALDGLFKSPLEPQQEGERQVLQIGCGNGAWCIDCAKEHPNWFVLGLDDRNGGPLISAASGKKMMSGTSSSTSAPSNPIILPSHTVTSSASISSSLMGLNTHGCNFTFIRSTTTLVNSLKMFPDGQFDLIYGRFLALALPPCEYEDLISECWRVCKPGGFVEFTELDMRIYGTHGSGTLIRKLNQQVVSAMKKQKLDPRLPRHLQDLFFKLLVDDQPASSHRRQNSYQVKYNSLPLGVWGGRLGVMFRDDIHDILDALHVTSYPVTDITNGSNINTPDVVDEDDDNHDDDFDDDDSIEDKANKNRNGLFEEDWTATTDILDDELDSQNAFMNIYQVYAQKHKD